MKIKRQNGGRMTTETTVENLEIPVVGGFIDSAEIIVEIEAEPYDAGDYWTPPSGGTCEIIDIVTVGEMSVTDDNGDDVKIDSHLMQAYANLVKNYLNRTGWADKQVDWATETFAAEIEGQYEAAQEARFDAMRDEPAHY